MFVSHALGGEGTLYSSLFCDDAAHGSCGIGTDECEASQLLDGVDEKKGITFGKLHILLLHFLWR